MAEKLKRDNATLAEAIKRLRSEAEEVARREGEAAEQVKSSVQVAEALRMEKTELEYEVLTEGKEIHHHHEICAVFSMCACTFSVSEGCEKNAVSQ